MQMIVSAVARVSPRAPSPASASMGLFGCALPGTALLLPVCTNNGAGGAIAIYPQAGMFASASRFSRHARPAGSAVSERPCRTQRAPWPDAGMEVTMSGAG